MPENKEPVHAEELKKVHKVDKQEKLNDGALRVLDGVFEQDEVIKKVYKPSKNKVFVWNLVKPIFIYSFFVLAFVFMFVFPADKMTQSDALVFLYAVSGIFVLMELYMILVSVKFMKNTFYVLTNKRLINSYGFFEVEYKWVELKDIDVVYNKKGKIVIVSKLENCENMVLVNMQDVNGVTEEIQDFIKDLS